MCFSQGSRDETEKAAQVKTSPTILFVVGRFLRLRRNTHWQWYASFDSLLSRAGYWHHGKGWIVCGTTTSRLHYWAKGSSTRAETGCAYTQLIGSSVADCQALT